MPERFDLLIKDGTIVNHDGAATGDVGIAGGKIARIGSIPREQAGEVFEAGGLHVLPGVIDSHVHFREPGAEQKEDLQSGSRAAVLGGVTAVFEMPNTSPPTVTADALKDKIARAKARMHCDFAFYVGATKDNIDALPSLEMLPGVAGVKIFMGSSTGSLLVDDDASLAAILARIRRRAAFHAEDEPRLIARAALRVEGDPRSHTLWRDAEAARLAIERLMRLARAAGKRVHVLHVSTAEEMALLAEHRDIASVEVTPHHLTLAAPDCYDRLGTRAQMNPPIRTADEVAAVWDALRQGVADTVGSDHAPHLLAEKAKPYPASPSGMPGVQTLVPVMLDHVHSGRLTLARLVDLTSHGPARIYGIAGKGRLAAGYDADLTIVDLKATREITDASSASRCGWTPYAGRRVTGWPMATIVRGTVVMRDGTVVNSAKGRLMRFLEALPADCEDGGSGA
jgi:dihydroorotase